MDDKNNIELTLSKIDNFMQTYQNDCKANEVVEEMINLLNDIKNCK